MNSDWEQVEELFHAALRLRPEERAAFLSKACAANTQLLSEVETLLSAHEEAGDFIATPAFSLAADLLNDARIENREGERLSHYEIISLLGRGGMGEVFLARDDRLDRRIALKLLPALFTENRDRLRRFEQEARAASALNHPNILTIYEVGEEDGTHYIATEYIEGQTLRRRITQGQVEIDEALDIAIQVASALKAAHEAGIVHRDIKPENIMLRPDGLVKVLDFGLVKLAGNDEEAHAVDAGPMPETPRGATVAGAVMGTFAYMSPEQASAKPVDTRSDIFSLGVVLYEMVAGRPPFDGESPQEVLDQILNQDAPPLSRDFPEAPADLQRIVARALARDRQARYQSARGFLEDLQVVKQQREFEAKLDLSGHSTGGRAAPSYGRWLWLAGGLLVAVALIWWIVSSRQSVTDANFVASLRRVEVAKWKSESGDLTPSGRFSPDGTQVVYTVAREGRATIWVRQPDGGAREVLADEWHNTTPIWSPDGKELAFISNRGGRQGVWRIPATGGEPRLISHLDLGGPRLERWSKSGTAIYFESTSGFYRLSLETGEVARVVEPETMGQAVGYSISPDETRIAYALHREGSSDIWVRRLNGEPFAVTRDEAEDQWPLWHPDGKRLIYNSNRDGTFQICIAYIDGRKPMQITFGEVDYSVDDVSADGTRILYTAAQEDSDIWRIETASGEEYALTSDVGCEQWPSVSADGRAVAFQATQELGGGRGIFNGSVFAMPADGAAGPVQFAAGGFDPRLSPDGRQLAFLRLVNDEVYLFVSSTGGEPRQLSKRGVFFEGHTVMPYNRCQSPVMQWSSDGRRILFCSASGGPADIYYVSVEDGVETAVTGNQDSNIYFNGALWSPDGQRIAYTANPIRVTAEDKRHWNLGVWENGRARWVYQFESPMRLLGWNRAGTGLVVIEAREGRGQLQGPINARLIEVTLDGKARRIANLDMVYYYNVELAPNGREVAYAARLDQRDQLWLVNVADGARRRLRVYTDQKIYLSSLTWSADSSSLYFSKQSRLNIVSMIDNFH